MLSPLVHHATSQAPRCPYFGTSGVLRSQRVYKKRSSLKCVDCETTLPGIPLLKSSEFRRTAKRVRTVSYVVYGRGTLCHTYLLAFVNASFVLFCWKNKKASKMVLADHKKSTTKLSYNTVVYFTPYVDHRA
jgi:ribosomal protein L34E